MKDRVLFLLLSVGTVIAANAQKIPTAPSGTGNAESIVRETSDPGQEFYPRISANGKTMLYNGLEKTTYFTVSPMGTLGIRTDKKFKIIKKEIGQPVTNPLVGDAAFPTWMPNGEVLFAYIKPARSVIVRTNAAGVGLNYISQGAMGEDDAEPVITRDGSKIYFTTIIGRSRMICSMDARGGGNFSVLTEGSHITLNPIDNTKIIFNARVGKVIQVFTMDLKTGQKAQLTTGDYNNKDGAFSTDGRYIAFVSNRENPARNNHHLYMMRAEGTEVTQLTQGDTDEGDPCFGPDGTIYFYSNAERNYNIWKVKARNLNVNVLSGR